MILRHLTIITLSMAVSAACADAGIRQDNDFTISKGWKVQSSEQVRISGDILSSGESLQTIDWYDASVPSTVLGTLTGNGLYKDLFFGKNYDSMLDRDDFKPSWWYVKQFQIPELKDNQRVALAFDGISYSAEIWLNGTKIASRDETVGPFRQFKFDVTDIIATENTLAVEVFRAEDGDFNIGFVDWNPRAADESMGIFRPVWIRYSNAVSVSNSAVHSKVDTVALDKAWLTFETTLTNNTAEDVKGTLVCTMDGKSFKCPISLKANEEKIVKLDSDRARMLFVKNPRLWWCHNLGNPEMYNMNVSFVIAGKESDSQNFDFGIRQIDTYMTPEGHRGFILNGTKVLVKGAGWTDDIFLRNTPERNGIELDYVKDMNLNAVRFENIWGTSQDIYDQCDRKGLLALVGWSCFWEWQTYSRTPNDNFGCIRDEDDMELIARSFNDQVLWLRNHPSIIAWYTGSDMLPRPALEEKYLEVLERTDDRPYIASAKGLTSSVTGPTGMKMVGPYDYQGPDYWYNPQAQGGAFGFNTETGIGAQLPVKESIMKMIPSDKIWPVGAEYDYHCTVAREDMHSLDVLKNEMDRRYGPSKNIDEFLMKAHHLDYDGTRAMFEAFRVKVPAATGVIQWMLNSAWPSLYWQLYDWYLAPCSGYWSVKKGCAPQQLVYNYTEKYVYAVNDEVADADLTAVAEVYDLTGNKVFSREEEVTMPAGAPVKMFEIPHFDDVTFLFLSLKDKSGKEVADNNYCLSPVDDVHDWARYNWIRTPLKQSADYTSLSGLGQAGMDVKAFHKDGKVEVELSNKSDKVAFFISMSLKDENGELVVPAFWSDNLVSLKPGETREYVCDVKGKSLDNNKIEISGWNVNPCSVNL